MSIRAGSLLIVGCGMTAGQLTIEASNAIAGADIVFELVPDWLSRELIYSRQKNVHSLARCYEDGKSRITAYQEMVELMLTAVRSGQCVCAVFYGHPGVFVHPSHEAITLARSEGFHAVMYPAVSAEDCLFADLGVDPGASGCQSYEASAFLFYKRRFEPSSALILWQVGVIGDHRCQQWVPHPKALSVLRDFLLPHYCAEHQVCFYEAGSSPLWGPKIQWLPMASMSEAILSTSTTLYIPSYGEPENNLAVLAALSISERELA